MVLSFEKAAVGNEDSKILDLLVGVYGDNEKELAEKYLMAAASDFFRKPTFVVAKDDDAIIGVASYEEELFTVATYGIGWVAVTPERRNTGVGQRLIQACIRFIEESASAPANIILLTYPNKTGLYERCGFQRMGKDSAGGSYMIYHIPRP